MKNNILIVGNGKRSVVFQNILNKHNIKFDVITRDYVQLKNVENKKIIIATPPNTHEKIASYFLDKNCTVFIEKPLSDNLEDINNFLIKDDKYKEKIYVGNKYVFSPIINKLKKIIRAKQTPSIIFSEWLKKMDNTSVSVQLDLLYHHFYLIDYLFDVKKTETKINYSLNVPSKSTHLSRELYCYSIIKMFSRATYINNYDDYRNIIKIEYNNETCMIKEDEKEILIYYGEKLLYKENKFLCSEMELLNFINSGKKIFPLSYHIDLTRELILGE